jgi:16S rRNA G966 N2-methylase RsmD
MAGIVEFGFTNPILVDEHLQVIAGHARLAAAQGLKMEAVPCVRLEDLSEPQKTALAIADNKLSDMSSFDPQALAAQLAKLCEIDFPTEITGFDTAEIDIVLARPSVSTPDPADNFADADTDARSVSELGDLWTLGPHRVLVADALEPSSYERALGDRPAQMVFADPPHSAVASGVMDAAEFKGFLSTYMAHLVRYSVNGSIHFHCMDWRYLPETLEAGAAHYDTLAALCVWKKTTSAMGPFFRSGHELVLVYKNGTAPHVRGRHGRRRTDVWDVPEADPIQSNSEEGGARLQTVKPVALVADAIRDCTKRGAVVLDPFAGSGTTILAAERTGRRATAIEIEPAHVDTAIRRWQKLSGGKAVLVGYGRSFDELEAVRRGRDADHD